MSSWATDVCGEHLTQSAWTVRTNGMPVVVLRKLKNCSEGSTESGTSLPHLDPDSQRQVFGKTFYFHAWRNKKGVGKKSCFADEMGPIVKVGHTLSPSPAHFP